MTATATTHLAALREKLADPDRVVLDPSHMFEDADGVECDRPRDHEPARACLIGWEVALGREDGFANSWATWNYLDQARAQQYKHGEGYTDALRQGRAVELVDRALEIARG